MMNTPSAELRIPRHGRDTVFFGVSALVFVLGAAVTIHGSVTMSMPWMRMPGQTWSGAAATFLVMWVPMMVAMMGPSLMPMLWRFRRMVGTQGGTCLGRLTALVGVAYFLVWTVLGMGAFALGAALSQIEARVPAVARAMPLAAGILLMCAGALQFTAWKAHHLACCRAGSRRDCSVSAAAAWRHGLRCGLHCSYCCAGLTAVLLSVGVMDLRAMAGVTLAISAERLAPAGERVARAIGAVVIGTGLLQIAIAAWFLT